MEEGFYTLRRISSSGGLLIAIQRHSNIRTDNDTFLRGHESEIILFEAAAREFKRLGAVPLPKTESMKTELAALAGKKESLLAEYRASRSQAQEYETIKMNVDALLHGSEEKVQSKSYELT